MKKISSTIVMFLPIWLLMGCQPKQVITYSNDDFAFTQEDSEKNCKFTVSLSNDKKIDYIYAICFGNKHTPTINELQIATKYIIKHFDLNDELKNSHIVKITLIQGRNSITNVEFLKYLNKEKKWSNDFERVSYKKHWAKMALLFEDSKMYDKVFKNISDNGCSLSPKYSTWLKDEELQTVTKTFYNEMLFLDGVFTKETARYDEYPSIEYIPFEVKCDKK